FFVPQNDNVTQTFKINNVRAKDLIRVVELFVKSNTSKSSNVLSIDGSNLLVVSAPKDILDNLPQFLSTVDLPTDQILIEGLIFEVQQGDALDFSF
ncbi:secretin N-terminal domain-containing protein, partial [Escherichia coli]|nr:general secretion pathway protein GspD [Escherichia coli]